MLLLTNHIGYEIHGLQAGYPANEESSLIKYDRTLVCADNHITVCSDM
ncbi:hypothetical protein O9992_05760 [Vibrio lentus]|nr:hypothetical protein [Vibrio lentus]